MNKQPWQLTKDEWSSRRESIRPNTAQSRPSKSDASTAIRRFQELEWLCYGISFPDRNVTWEDVIDKARREGKLLVYGRDDLMVIAAFRYCLGRQSYIVSDCADWLISNWHTFSKNTTLVIRNEIEDAFKKHDELIDHEYSPLGSDCDVVQWGRVRALWAKS